MSLKALAIKESSSEAQMSRFEASETLRTFRPANQRSTQYNPLKLFKELVFNIYLYREYLKQSVARDLRKQYKRSYLGYLWSMLNPLLMMSILAVVFSSIMRQNIEDYAVFLFTGMIPFAYFNSTLNGCLGTIRANSKIIDQMPVPKYLFPLSVAFSNLVTFFLSLIPLIIVTLVLGRSLEFTMLALPIILLPLFLVSLGGALVLACANVFFEDTAHLIQVVLRALYFLSPILYRRDQLPEWLQEIVIYLNPMFLLIEFMRDLFYHGTLPELATYSLHLLGCFLVLYIGLYVFKKSEGKFIYYI